MARDFRNRGIGDFLKELGLTEGRDTGFPAIYRAMDQNGSPQPAFETDNDCTCFLTTLPATVMEPEVKEISKGEKLSKIQLQIIEAIQNDNRITQVKLSELTGHSETSIDNNIRKLREIGIVTRIGPAKGGYWQLSS